MGNTLQYGFLTFLFLSLPLFAGETPAFLEQPVPAALIRPPANPDMKSTPSQSFLQFDSFLDRMANLQAVARRPILYPAGFVNFIQTKDHKSDWDKGTEFFLSERNGSPVGSTTRDDLTSSFRALDLTWKYDGLRDAIATDFCWRRDDSRSAAELTDVLLHTNPNIPKPFYLRIIDYFMYLRGAHGESAWIDPHWRYYFNHHHLAPDDSWRIAFDALLSKPKNFPRAWTLRFAEDARINFTSSFVENFLAKEMPDDKGRHHIVVLNAQYAMGNKSPGSFSYYVFDQDGGFEMGGILNGVRGFSNASAWLDSGKNILTVQSQGNVPNLSQTTYVLTDHGLLPASPGISTWIGGDGVLYKTAP